MDKLTEIETFVDVVRHGSFAATAKAQRVTAVMIGRRISQLEKRLGGRLFHRTTRSLELTPEAVAFHASCTALLARLAATERLVAHARTRATGELIVTVPASFGREHVYPRLDEFMTENPDVTVTLYLSDRTVDIVRQDADLGIRVGEPKDPALTSIAIGSIRTLVVGTPGYFACQGRPERPEDLLRHNCLTFCSSGEHRRDWWFRTGSGAVAVEVRGRQACNDGQILRRWAAEGLGLAWLPDYDVVALLASGRLETVLDDFAVPQRPLMAIYPRQKHPPAKTVLFIAWLRSIYQASWAAHAKPEAPALSAEAPE